MSFNGGLNLLFHSAVVLVRILTLEAPILMVLPFFSRRVDSAGCGSGRGGEPGRRQVPRLIQNPFSASAFGENLAWSSRQNASQAQVAGEDLIDALSPLQICVDD